MTLSEQKRRTRDRGEGLRKGRMWGGHRKRSAESLERRKGELHARFQEGGNEKKKEEHQGRFESPALLKVGKVGRLSENARGREEKTQPELPLTTSSLGQKTL